MTNKTAALEAPPGARRMQLRYGFNEIDGWWHISLGEHSEQIRRQLRLMDTQVIRIFVFGQPVPDPIKDWHLFAAYVQAVLDVGARPMVTFAKFPPPYDDERNIRTFVARCTELVWSCIEQWGGEEVKGWYWCIWNEPNNRIIGGGLTFSQYRAVYERVARSILNLLQPHLGKQKARIGGPAIDGTHRPYWMDWIVRLVTEVDDSLVGFVSWHRYGDWRPAVPSASLDLEMWGSPDPPTGAAFEALLMTQTPSYEARARGVARLLKDRDILNVCGELNSMAHHEQYYTLGLNQNAFGAAYYASALIHLIRGGADLEMRWTATAHERDAYGLMTMRGEPTPAGLVKQMFVQYIRCGDWVRFPAHRLDAPDVDAIVTWGDGGRRSGVFVNTSNRPRTLTITEWDDALPATGAVLRPGTGAGNRVIREAFDRTIRLDGYGVAIVTNRLVEAEAA
jgi:Glycosyl hydrolases family 39